MRELTELYYFSPTGGTKKAGMLLCEGISWDIEAVDLGKKKEEPRQPKGNLVVAAMPVFGGRLPGVAAEKLRTLEGKEGSCGSSVWKPGLRGCAAGT